MLSKMIAAMIGTPVAEISFVFEGRTHNEVIDLDDDSFDYMCEMDRMLSIYEAESPKQDLDSYTWIERARDPEKVYFGFPEYMVNAADDLQAIFDTYAQETYVYHTTTLVDHQGNRTPLEIERK